MKNQFLLLALLGVLTTFGCGGSGGSDASNRIYHFCFSNNQGTTIYGIGYRESGTTSWHRINFDDPVAQNEGFDYDEGILEEEPPGDGLYDVMCFDDDGNPVKQWSEVEYAKYDYGMVVNPTAEASIFGRVNSECHPNGILYYDDPEPSKCEANGGYCVEGALCDTEHFPWYAWGCETSNCCLPETASCNGLGGQCMRIEDIQNCHDLGYKAANSLDWPGSPLTTICCMPVD